MTPPQQAADPRPETVDTVKVSLLVASDSPRSAENRSHIRLLAELDVKLPPIVVHRPTMRIIDGTHRSHAAILRGDDEIEVRYFDGSEADAFVVAVELNGAHGLPLSRAERTAAAARIVRSHPQWSDRRIAKVVGLAANTVGSIRQRVGSDLCSTVQNEQLNTSVGLDGRLRPRDSARRRKVAEELIKQKPNATLREIAGAAGISPATAGSVRAALARGEFSGERPPDHIPVPREKKHASAAEAEAAALCTVSREAVNLLMKDPSLRSTDAGKTLLRALAMCAIDSAQWEKIIEAVPAYHQLTVIRLARECAAMWEGFASRLPRQVASSCSQDVI